MDAMNDMNMTCQYAGNREQAIVSYLYGDDAEFDRSERATFEAHLSTCARCRDEVTAFDDVRGALGSWAPPALRALERPSLGTASAALDRASAPPQANGARQGDERWWRAMPVWAQTAAALLCVGVAAGVANLDISYDAAGLRVRTGWLAAPAAPVGDDAPGEQAAASGDAAAPWRAELADIERRLQAELRVQNTAEPLATPPGATEVAAPAAPLSPEATRRVRALVDASERRQQRELALRLAEAIRDVNAQRQADLMRIDRNIGAIQSNTGREMLRQRSEMLNYVTVRTASQRPQ
jgi:hypothetical protein